MFRIRIFGLSATAAIVLAACSVFEKPVPPPPPPVVQPAEANPFFEPSPLPFQAPQFDRIKDSDFQPPSKKA